MRRWLLVLMLLLLPLRGWVGEAMAGQMMRQHAALAVTHLGHAGHHRHDGAVVRHHGDCDEHAPAGAAEPAHADCATCATCQVCSSVALSTTVLLPLAGSFTHPRPDTVQPRYASAEPLLAFKPPRG